MVNFLHLENYMPTDPANEVYISQLMRYPYDATVFCASNYSVRIFKESSHLILQEVCRDDIKILLISILAYR